MFTESDAELKKMGADITARKTQQQPSLWKEVFKIYQEKKQETDESLVKINQEFDKVEVISTDVGTSACVSNTMMPCLRKRTDRTKYDFETIDTTKIVSTSEDYLEVEAPTILVSFTRGSNSSESVATVELAKQLVTGLYQIVITYAPGGHLAQDLRDDPNELVLLIPAKSLNQGFAMTGSFPYMSLATLLVFDTKNDAEKETIVSEIAKMGKNVVDREVEVQKLVDTDFDRITYIDSDALGGLAEEARLRILELAAGKVATLFDISMGLRHGPKLFLDKKTIVFDLVLNNSYTRRYDLDILDEIKANEVVPLVMGVGQLKKGQNFGGKPFAFSGEELPDAYPALPDIIFGQTIALLTSARVGNTPDTSSPIGTVSRVVKGVTIHKFVK